MRLGAPIQVGRPRRRFMGQAGNRLLGVRTMAVLSRRLIASVRAREPMLPFARQQALRALEEAGISPDEYAVLSAVADSPTQEELGDLSLVDSFFAWDYGRLNTYIPSYPPRCGDGPLANPSQADRDLHDRIQEEMAAHRAFYCPPEHPDVPAPPSLIGGTTPMQPYAAGYRFFPIPPSARAVFWDIDLGNPWGAIKGEPASAIPNMLLIEERLRVYPWPIALADYLFAVIKYLLPALRDLVRIPGTVSETFARVFITSNIAAYIQNISADLEVYMRDQAENERRRRITTIIGTVAVGALLSIAAAPAIISKGFTALGQYASREQQRAFAEDLEAAAENMRAEDPAFASELSFASRLLDFLNRNLGDLEGMTPEEQNEAVDAALLGIPAWVWVAGGAAALGVGAYFLFRG